MWIYCRKELEEFNNLYSNDNTKLSRKTLVHNAITDLPPQLKRSLLLSLKSKRFPSRASCRDECQEFVYKLHIHPRRTFKKHHHQRRRGGLHGSLGTARKEASQVEHPSHHPRKKVILKVGKTANKHHSKSQKKPPDHVILIGIIVSTAVATLSLFLLLLFCCLGGNGRNVGSECAEKDGKPCVGMCPAHTSGKSSIVSL